MIDCAKNRKKTYKNTMKIHDELYKNGKNLWKFVTEHAKTRYEYSSVFIKVFHSKIQNT
jgi:hypothetical protein